MNVHQMAKNYTIEGDGGIHNGPILIPKRLPQNRINRLSQTTLNVLLLGGNPTV